jgi:transglutaminase-like putative cysteine protease
MRLSIDHHVRYRFSEPQTRVVQLLRMTPNDTEWQTIIDWNIGVDCDARLRYDRDGYGNITTMLYVDGPIEAIELIVTGEVLTEDGKGRVAGTVEPLPPLFYTRTTSLTDADDAIIALSAGLPGRGVEDAFALAALVSETVKPRERRTPKSRTAAEVLALGSGNVRDCAHLLIAAARAAGFPARFVTGHCLSGPHASAHHSAHCWVEMHVEGEGWFSYDPSAGCHPGENYVRVGMGLDASDSTPLSGTRRGGGIEELDIDIRVAMSQKQG